MLFLSNPSSHKPTLSSFLSPSRHSRRRKMSFSTPAWTSPTTRQILSTPTSDQLSPTDTWRNKRLPSTLLSHLTEQLLPRGERLCTQEHSSNTFSFASYIFIITVGLFVSFNTTSSESHDSFFCFPLRTRGQETGEDPAALYSTVNKTSRAHQQSHIWYFYMFFFLFLHFY